MTTTDAPEVVIITGLSGAGRSTAGRALEDIGFFVIDNMPPALLARVVELSLKSGDVRRLAFGCDLREGHFFVEMDEALETLEAMDASVEILFCDASDEALLRRFEESRRPHPLGDDSVLDGIRREREQLMSIRDRSDLVVDTSDMNVHVFRQKVKGFFAIDEGEADLRVAVQSFGFKHGPPRNAQLVFDVRFLPNPHWVDRLRPLPGTSEPVRQYVLEQPDTEEFLERVFGLVDFLLPGYIKEGKTYLTIAIGCTGGHHRSVVLTEELANHIREGGYGVAVEHRDLHL